MKAALLALGLAVLMGGCGTVPLVYTKYRPPLVDTKLDNPDDAHPVECRETWATFWKYSLVNSLSFYPVVDLAYHLGMRHEYECRAIKGTP